MIELDIQGMTCGHCVRAVTEAIQNVKGVTNVQVNLQPGSANVEGEPNPEDLLAAIREEGYQAQVRP
jgi:copper chaperone